MTAFTTVSVILWYACPKLDIVRGNEKQYWKFLRHSKSEKNISQCLFIQDILYNCFYSLSILFCYIHGLTLYHEIKYQVNIFYVALIKLY